jgi:hypothetical protein
MRLLSARSFLCALFVLSVLSCREKKGPLAVIDPDDTAPPVRTRAQPGLTIRLSHADDEGSRAARPKLAEATVLSAADTSKVLARLPKLPALPGDEQDFALRPSTTPPPVTGATVLGAFPPAASPKPATAKPTGPLEVVRFAPEGAVPLAPHLSLTFSHPMVEVTSLAELAAKDVPVKLTPQPEGKWRWVGTKTLMFEPTAQGGRFPMATRYAVEVAAGTASGVGSKLAKATSFTFETPAPTVKEFHPQGGPTRLRPVMFVAFDQEIDPAAVVPFIELAARGTGRKVRLAKPEEIEADDTVRALSEQATKGRWLAVVPVDALPPATRVQVAIGPKVPSKEGPRTSNDVARHEFSTFGPMQVVAKRCGYDGNCPPGMPFEIETSNPIDPVKFDRAMVKVDPEIPDMRIDVWGNSLVIEGPTKGRTKYEVTISESLPDMFGQRLGKQETARFKVGEAPQSLWAQGSGLVVLDPAAGADFAVYSTNHTKLRARAFAVTPSQWRDYLKMLERVGNDSRDLSPPGKRVFDKEIAVKRDDDAIVETAINLEPALRGGLGHAIVIVEPTEKPKEPWMQQRVIAWVQATKIGLSAHVDDDDMLVWANALGDGSPLSGVSIELSGGPKGTTATDGLATIALGAKAAPIVVATKGDDTAFLPESIWWWSGGDGSWKKSSTGDELRWYVFDDRHLYRPGEKVHIKGWIRTITAGKSGDVAAPTGVKQIGYTATDAQGNKIGSGTLTLNAFGAFDSEITLPKTPSLGPAQLQLEVKGARKGLPGAQWWHSFEIQEFRRPEYEVESRFDEGPHLVGGDATATVSAKYYAGGALPNAEVQWVVSSSPGFYQPPGNDGWSFGKVDPWWCFWRHWGPWKPDPANEPRSSNFAATTDAGGEHRLKIDFVSVEPARPMSLEAQATVIDVNRQAWTSRSSTVVHAADRYIGIKSERAFVQAGESIEIDAIVTDIDGKRVVDGPIAMRAVRLQTEQVKGEYVETELDAQTCDRTSATDPVRCTFAAAKGGSWRIVATTTDARGRSNRTEIELWVAGGDLPAPRDVSQEQVLLIPDASTYEVGQTAKVAVAAPWPGAHGIVTLRRSGIVETRSIRLDGTSTVIEVPITDALVPNVEVHVDLAGSAPRRGANGKLDPKLPPRVAFAVGSASLSIPPRQRTLVLDVRPAVAKIEPGGKTTVDVDVRGADGRAVAGAEVALVVVDEAVLALTGYDIGDPMAAFYGFRDGGTRDHYLRQQVLLATDTSIAQEGGGRSGAPGGGGGGGDNKAEADMAAPSAAPPAEPMPKPALAERRAKNGGGKGGEAAPIAMRTNFDALALFTPSVTTDASGRASVPLSLPDNLTRYRIMAVAASGERRFGTADASITARLPLMVRPSAPRFMNFGDKIELPVVVQNQTDSPMTVDVAVRAHNAELTAGGGRRVQVPANDRVEVRFPTSAAFAGTARFQVGAASAKWADAAQLELPVWTPATTEAFATYGEIDKGAITQPVKAPASVFTQFGGLEISTTSTAVAALTDAVLYLVAYPFECSEQVGSRVLAIAALRDVLTAFRAEGLPPPKELEAAVKRDLGKLERMQTDDGGFSFWGRGWPSWPYLTAHVTHALERARLEGFAVDGRMLERARDYLRDIEGRIPADYPVEVKRAIRAYALYVLGVGGSADVRKAHALLDEVALEKHPLEVVAWLLPTFAGDGDSRKTVAAIHRLLQSKVSETAAGAHFVTSYSDGAHLLLHSDRRVDALLLEGLIASDPKSDLIPKLVKGLLDHRKAGRWSSTQENGFVLVALDRYFETFEKATPDFVAKAWLGKDYAGDHSFKGRTTETHRIDIPMEHLAQGKSATRDLVLAKQGTGRLYYRIGMRYAPRDLKLEPYDAGFAVTRRYEAIDDPKDVTRDDDGTWRIKAGARVRVRLEMVAESRRYHVALVDPLPAGLEPMNPALATTGALPADPEGDSEGGDRWWWWWRTWYEHQNLRDERVEAFTSLLWEGVHDYDYVARATTPGEFVVPPPKAEEMYHPETFGRGASDRVIVE